MRTWGKGTLYYLLSSLKIKLFLYKMLKIYYHIYSPSDAFNGIMSFILKFSTYIMLEIISCHSFRHKINFRFHHKNVQRYKVFKISLEGIWAKTFEVCWSRWLILSHFISPSSLFLYLADLSGWLGVALSDNFDELMQL